MAVATYQMNSMAECETVCSNDLAQKVEEMKTEDVIAAGNENDEDDVDEDDVVDPWKVESKSAKGIDYDKLISKFENMHCSLTVDL